MVSVKRVQNEANNSLKKSADGDIIGKKVSYSMKDRKWHPDLSKKQLIELMKVIDRDVITSTNSITDKANWLLTRMDGMSVFAIYSTESTSKPTLLYESKGEQAVFERDYLLELIGDDDGGKSNERKSSFTERVSTGDWVRKSSNDKYNAKSLARGSSNRNAGVLQGQSERNTSPAFRSVVGNLFKVRGKIDSKSELKFSFKKSVETTKDLVAYHNASEKQLTEALLSGKMIMPSIAVTKKSFTDFGDISI